MNQAKRKIVISSQQNCTKIPPLQPTNDKPSTQSLIDQEEQTSIQSMAKRKSPPQPQLHHHHHHPKTQNPSQKPTRTNPQKQNQQITKIKPKKKLIIHQRQKKQQTFIICDNLKIIDQLPSGRRGLQFQDNSNKMPYRFNL